MNLQYYQSQTADILLWRPLRLREYLICWTIRSPYHHASFLDVDYSSNVPYSLDQNIDLVSKRPMSFCSLLSQGYRFDVVRYRDTLDEQQQMRLRLNFLRLQTMPYSYFMALRVLFGRSYLPPGVYPKHFSIGVHYRENSWYKLDVIYENLLVEDCLHRGKQRRYWSESYTSLTCSGAVILTYCLSGFPCFTPDMTLERRLRHPVMFLPSDFLLHPLFKNLGTISCDTKIST